MRALAQTTDLSLKDGDYGGERVPTWRGRSDLTALIKRYHDAEIHSRLAPSEAAAGAAFRQLEHARISLLGRGKMSGVAANIDGVCGDKKFYQLLCGQPGTPPPKVGALLRKMRGAIAMQNDFALLARQLLRLLANETPPRKTRRNPPQKATPPRNEKGDGRRDEARRAPERSDRKDQGRAMAPQAMAPRAMAASPSTAGGWRSPRPPDEGDYKIFSRSHDRLATPNQLEASERLDELYQSLKSHMAAMASATSKLAARLGRKLMAKNRTHIRFECEEGLLDNRRLARLVTGERKIFKSERNDEWHNSVVALLIDNSGSMRGQSIAASAVCATILSETLERCGVAVEILGFTTSSWKGGRVREEWLRQGAKDKPGRLNELLHIVYKDAATPHRRARRNLALMLSERLLKENIDGEALLWACSRLAAHGDKRRILLVISDGAPVDDSTLSANDGGFLERHLKRVISHIQTNTPIELLAVGIGHDVSNYYQQAVTIADTSQPIGRRLGDTLANELEALFTYSENSRRKLAGREFCA